MEQLKAGEINENPCQKRLDLPLSSRQQKKEIGDFPIHGAFYG